VYDGQDERLARRVALKFLPDEMAGDPDATRRFRREAQTIALLNHPQICTIYEVDDHEGHPFIAMERLEGSNLKAFLAKKTLETEEIVDIALQIARALEAAHEKGVIHRDIKPGNIFVSDTGHVKVLDFGLARRIPTVGFGGSSVDGSTILGRPIGTASYMAPERILQMPLDPRCDLLAGRRDVRWQEAAVYSRLPAETVTNILERTDAVGTCLRTGRGSSTGSSTSCSPRMPPTVTSRASLCLDEALRTRSSMPISRMLRRLFATTGRSPGCPSRGPS
jgi:serine/threonine protein kinase